MPYHEHVYTFIKWWQWDIIIRETRQYASVSIIMRAYRFRWRGVSVECYKYAYEYKTREVIVRSWTCMLYNARIFVYYHDHTSAHDEGWRLNVTSIQTHIKWRVNEMMRVYMSYTTRALVRCHEHVGVYNERSRWYIMSIQTNIKWGISEVPWIYRLHMTRVVVYCREYTCAYDKMFRWNTVSM